MSKEKVFELAAQADKECGQINGPGSEWLSAFADKLKQGQGEPVAILRVKMHTHDMGQSLAPNPPFKAAIASAYQRAESLPVGDYDLYTSAPTTPEGWQPIETAPEGALVVVGWLDNEDSEHPERYDLDWLEGGVWSRHEDLVQHADACAPAGSRMPSQTAPYTHWLPLAAIPAAPKHTKDEDQPQGATP